MKHFDGFAVVYCEGSFNTPNGKTAHGLVRFTERYKVIAVIDSNYAGQDSGMILDNRKNDIPVVASLNGALDIAKKTEIALTHFVVGLAPDGGRLPVLGRDAVKEAIILGLHVDSGLHDFLSEDKELTALALEHGSIIRDIRKPPHRNQLHFFTGDIEKVNCLKIAVLGTDSAIGKRTTAWILVHALRDYGLKAELIGTGQTAWLQGARYSLVMDSLVNDFVSGEIEHAVVSAWEHENPDVIVIEGQGSLMNPAYPGGFEILAAGRPDIVILQLAPGREEYDGFPGYPIHPLNVQIQAIELLSGRKVVALTVNHENIPSELVKKVCEELEIDTGLPTVDPLIEGGAKLVDLTLSFIKTRS